LQPGLPIEEPTPKSSKEGKTMRNFAKIIAAAAVPAMAVTLALPALSASASTRPLPILPAPAHVSAQVSSQGWQSDSVSVSWKYGNFSGVKFQVIERQGSWSAVEAVTSGHSVTLQNVPNSWEPPYRYSVVAMRSGNWPWGARNSRAGNSNPLYVTPLASVQTFTLTAPSGQTALTGSVAASSDTTAVLLGSTAVATITDTGNVNEVPIVSATLTGATTVSVSNNQPGLLVGGSYAESITVTFPTGTVAGVHTGSVTATVNGVTETLLLTVTVT
jgi:hypothetical protein